MKNSTKLNLLFSAAEKMKYAIIALLLLTAAANALSVDSIAVNPGEVWLGDSVNITAVCTGNETVNRSYVDITGPGIILPSLEMTNMGGGAYALNVPGNYFDRRGSYTATVNCVAGNVTANGSGNFIISEMTASITSATSPTYQGDTIEIVFVPKKNDVTITSGITFVVFLDDAATQLKMPAVYDTAKGWVLRIDAPTAKTYMLSVSANYQGKSISASRSIEVKPQVDFTITYADKYSFQKGDNVSLDIRSSKRGMPMALENFAVRINGATAAVNSLTQNGNSYNVKIAAPDISAGRYQLTAETTNNGTLYTSSINISYISKIQGVIDGKSMSIGFFKSGSEVLHLDTLSDGTYSGQIVPDTYDVELKSADASITLKSANVNTFNAPVNYLYTPGMAVDGFATSGVYYVQTSWSFDHAEVKLKYDPTYFEDENSLSVFKCSSWTGGKCTGDWVKITPQINQGDNTVAFNVSSFSAFIVGNEQKIKVTLNFDKKKYAKRDLVSVRGSAMAGSTPMKNATIKIKIENSYVDHTVFSNQNGAFSLDFLGPEEEANHTIIVTGKKSPYVSYSGTYNLEVINMPSFSVVFPGSVQVSYAGEKTEDIMIVNTGQTEITGLKVEIKDVDGKLYKLGDYPGSLGIKQEIHVPATFYGGTNATTFSATLKIISNEVSQEKLFGFTILEAQKPAAPVTGFAVSMPNIGIEAAVIVLFAAGAFSAAFILKRRKVSGHHKKRHYDSFEHLRPATPAEKTHLSGVAASNTSVYLADVKNYLEKKS